MNIAVIGGDGTGPEVAAEGVKVLKAVAKLEGFDKDLKLTDLDWGGDRYLKTGEALPADGARPAPQVRLHPAGRRRPSRREAGHPRAQAAARPALRPRPVHQPAAGEAVPRRRDAAAGQEARGHRLHRRPREHRGPLLRRPGLHAQGHAQRSRHANGPLHPQGLRALRSATPSSSRKKRNNPKGKKLTLVAKTNVILSHDLWWRTFQEVGAEYPDIEKDYNHVDACCMWIVKNPEFYDVIVTTNMFGDIITDLSRHHPGRHGRRRRRQHQPRARAA